MGLLKKFLNRFEKKIKKKEYFSAISNFLEDFTNDKELIEEEIDPLEPNPNEFLILMSILIFFVALCIIAFIFLTKNPIYDKFFGKKKIWEKKKPN